ncbi:MAG: TolC family outer membrane protein [Cellvibrionales bacterium]|nr:TolC family outer membrane protein [Cellvibrionales bacterium]
MPILVLLGQVARADTLQQIFDLSLARDPQIRAAEAQLRAAQSGRALGRAGLLPQLSLAANYTDTRIRGDAANTDAQSDSASATLDQALFDLPAWYVYRQGDARAKQAEQDYLAAQQNLIIRATRRYFQVLDALDSLAATKAEEVALASQLNQARQRHRAGGVAITDVHEAQAAYDDVVARLLDAQAGVGIAFEGLRVLTGQNHLQVAPLRGDFPIAEPEPVSAQAWVDKALAGSFALKGAALARDAARYNAQSKKWEHLPSLSLRLSHAENSGERAFGGMPVNQDVGTSSLTLNLQAPLYLGGAVSAGRRQARHQYLAAEESLNQVQRTLVQDTRSQHLRVGTKVAEVRARHQAVISSQSAYEATRAGYRAGTRNLVDLLAAEQALYRARRNYTGTRYAYILDLFRLNELAGSLRAQHIRDIDDWLDPTAPLPRSLVERSGPGLPLPAPMVPVERENGGEDGAE